MRQSRAYAAGFHIPLLLACLTNVAHAQTGSLSGDVQNNQGKAIAGAAVIIRELDQHTVTDEDGHFEFNALPYADYTLVISGVQIRTASIAVTLDPAAKIVNPSVTELTDRELGEVTVHGQTLKRKIETSGFAVNVVEPKEASLRNMQTNELLNPTVGVRVRQSGGIGSDANYNLNGMSGRAIGVFIDGIEISARRRQRWHSHTAGARRNALMPYCSTVPFVYASKPR